MKTNYKQQKLKKEITFFYSDHIEKVAWFNLKKKFKQNGFKTSFSKNLKKKTEIGFYNHDQNIKNNAKFSVVSLHGMDQGRTCWPNAWKKTSWANYDIGLLPGKKWSQRWKESSNSKSANPRIGVFDVGWPKSDDIKSFLFRKKVKKIKKKLNKNKKTLLYAPSFETDNKQLDILELAKKLKLNLIVKHWPSKDDKKLYYDVYNNTIKMNKISKKSYKDVFIFPPKTNIFYYLASADILITDESSVMYEAMLFNIPTVIPNDWKMRTNNSNNPRKIQPSNDAYLNCKIKDLPKNVKFILGNQNKIKRNIEKQKIKHFSNLEFASKKVFDLINLIISNKNINSLRIRNKKIDKNNILKKFINFFIE